MLDQDRRWRVASCNGLTTTAALAVIVADGYTVSYGGNTDYLPSNASAGLIG